MRPLLFLGPVLALSLATGGCGFHPLNQPRAVAQLPDIFVNTIPAGRDGQLLRQALQQRLAGSDDSSPGGYTLQVGYGLSAEAIGIHGDNTSGRTREVARADWTLLSVSPAPKILATGSARSVDGYNVIEAQYFAQTLAGETTSGRLAGNLADAVQEQLVAWFAAHPEAADRAAVAANAAPAPVPGSVPAPAKQRGFLGPNDVPGDSDQSPLQQIGPDGLPAGAIGRTYQ
ncbi:hypothetical protein [Lichenicoccus sp.]|uniref:hypothetical protein n=1 Tax=Lichenicoccus sp. TaxID=2781899 RepID=UPI003D136633